MIKKSLFDLFLCKLFLLLTSEAYPLTEISQTNTEIRE